MRAPRAFSCATMPGQGDAVETQEATGEEMGIIVLRAEAEIEGQTPDSALARVLARVPVPR